MKTKQYGEINIHNYATIEKMIFAVNHLNNELKHRGIPIRITARLNSVKQFPKNEQQFYKDRHLEIINSKKKKIHSIEDVTKEEFEIFRKVFKNELYWI